MRRAILGTALAPAFVVGVGLGLSRVIAGYFTNTAEWADRIGMETNAHIDAMIAAGIYGPTPEEPCYTASQQLSPMEGDTP